MKNVTLPKIFQPYHCKDIIRLGKDNDGGYLINEKDIHKTQNLMTFGIGEDVSFEKMFIDQNEYCDLYGYDSTIGNDHDEFFVDRKKLYREKVTSSNIEDILSDKNDIFLNCDIDGGEYEILYNLIKHSDKFTGLVIEFHDISKYDKFNEVTNFISKFELRLVHVHINNYTYIVHQNFNFTPDVIELTFTSTKENTELKRNINLPHSLDMPNNSRDDEFKISF